MTVEDIENRLRGIVGKPHVEAVRKSDIVTYMGADNGVVTNFLRNNRVTPITGTKLYHIHDVAEALATKCY